MLRDLPQSTGYHVAACWPGKRGLPPITAVTPPPGRRAQRQTISPFCKFWGSAAARLQDCKVSAWHEPYAPVPLPRRPASASFAAMQVQRSGRKLRSAPRQGALRWALLLLLLRTARAVDMLVLKV